MEERQLDMLEVGGSKPSPPTNATQTSAACRFREFGANKAIQVVARNAFGATRADSADEGLVARAGFEPAISALKGLRPSPLDDRAVLGSLGTLIAVPACKPFGPSGKAPKRA